MAFVFVLYPLYIVPIFNNEFLDNKGITYTVQFFGKFFAESSLKDSDTVVFASATKYLYIFLILLALTGIPIALSFFFRKGYSFAASAFAGVFGAKSIIGLTPILIPMEKANLMVKIFGAVDSFFCLVACVGFVFYTALGHSKELKLDENGISSCRYREKLYGILFALFAALIIFKSYAMAGYGINWSIFLGRDNQKMYQGLVLVILLGTALICASKYLSSSMLPLCFFAAFGASSAFSDLFALVNKVIWCFTEYKEHKSAALAGDESERLWLSQDGMTRSWWRRTIFILICALLGGAIVYFSFVHLLRRIKIIQVKNKQFVQLCICGGSALMFLASTLTAVSIWDHRNYNEFVLGAMDYMYFIVFGGIILISVLALICGHSEVKWGLLSIYVIFGAENFGSIFRVLRVRRNLAEQYPGYVGYAYIASAVWFGISLLCALTVIILFVSKELDDYLYRIKTAEIESEITWYDRTRELAYKKLVRRKQEAAVRKAERAVRRAENKKISDARKAERAVQRAEAKKVSDAEKAKRAAERAEAKKVSDAEKAKRAAERAEEKKKSDVLKAEEAAKRANERAEQAARHAEEKKQVDAKKEEARKNNDSSNEKNNGYL